MISRTSNAHTIASIELYEIGQDRWELATSPCIVLTNGPSKRHKSPLRQRRRNQFRVVWTHGLSPLVSAIPNRSGQNALFGEGKLTMRAMLQCKINGGIFLCK
jgi:hypothetical protein